MDFLQVFEVVFEDCIDFGGPELLVSELLPGEQLVFGCHVFEEHCEGL